jgi:hypothetical protein
MFSFVPARRAAGAGSGFARPAIQLDGLLNPNAPMPARVLDVGAERLPEHWRTVVDAVTANQLVFATNLRLGALAAS